MLLLAQLQCEYFSDLYSLSHETNYYYYHYFISGENDGKKQLPQITELSIHAFGYHARLFAGEYIFVLFSLEYYYIDKNKVTKTNFITYYSKAEDIMCTDL